MPSGSVMLILGRHFILVLYCPVAQHCLKASVPFSLSLLITVYIYIIGFGDRLLLEMKKITPNSLKIRVNLSLSLYLFILPIFQISAPQDRIYSTWMGYVKNCYFCT